MKDPAAVLEGIIFRYLKTKKEFDEEEVSMHILLITALAIGGIAYILLSVFFIAAHCLPLAVCHGIGFLVVLLLLIPTVKYIGYAPVVTVLALVVVITAGFIVWYAGEGSAAMVYPTMVFVILIHLPIRKRWVALYAVFFGALTCGFYLLGLGDKPRWDLGNFMTPLAVINILTMFLGLALFHWFEIALRQIMARFSLEHMAELEEKVFRDSLTGLYNRHYAEKFFAQVAAAANDRREKKPGCIAMADIDDFKKINDIYGHDAGDLCLKTISTIIVDSLRKTDLVIRWGGEEILIILQDVELDNGCRQLDRIRETVAASQVRYADHYIKMSITIGAASLNPADVKGSVKECDNNLYEGKRSGKNRVVPPPSQ